MSDQHIPPVPPQPGSGSGSTPPPSNPGQTPNAGQTPPPSQAPNAGNQWENVASGAAQSFGTSISDVGTPGFSTLAGIRAHMSTDASLGCATVQDSSACAARRRGRAGLRPRRA